MLLVDGDRLVARGGLDPLVAISYNPNLDYYPGSSTPVIDSQDAVYCINYVLKRWRFVYNSSVTCSPAGAVVAVDIMVVTLGQFISSLICLALGHRWRLMFGLAGVPGAL